MSHFYTGNPATAPASITLPDDGDDKSVASVNVSFEGLADQLAWLRAYALDPDYTTGHTATWETGAIALFKGGAQSTYQSGALSNYLSGSITTFELNSYLHLDGTTYITSFVNVNTGGAFSFFAGSHLLVGSGADFGAEVWFKVGSVFKVDCATSFSSGTEVDYKPGSVQYWEGDSVLTGTVRLAGAGRITMHRIIGPDANASYSATSGQIILVPPLTAPRVYTFLAAGASVGDVMSVSMGPAYPGGSSHACTLKREDASTIFFPLIQTAGSLGWMDIVFDGANWQPLRWGSFS